MVMSRKLTEEEAYAKYKSLLYRIALSFHATTGLEVEELVGEATIAFLLAFRTFDPKKGELAPRISVCVKHHLCTYIRTQKKFSEVILVDVEEDELLEDPRDDIRQWEEFESFLGSLSKEAKELITLILSAPSEYAGLTSRQARGMLVKTLRGKGWAWSSIWNTFREIRSALTV